GGGGAGGDADRAGRLGQRQLRGVGLWRWQCLAGQLPALREPVVAAAELQRRLHPVAWHRRGLRRWCARWCLTDRHPDGAPDDGGGRGAVPASAVGADVPAAGHAWLGDGAGCIAGAADHPRHPQRQTVAAAGGGGDAQWRRGGAAVRAGHLAGAPARPGVMGMKTTWRDYWDLTKPKVVALIVFTALVGMCLAVPTWPTAEQTVAGALGFIGIWLSAAAAAAINQLLDARIDAQMARTSWRPLVVGKVS